MDEKGIHKSLQLSARIIKTQTGIELTPAEFLKLRIYYLRIKGERQYGEWSRIGTYECETRARFLYDLFGIDFLGCIREKLCGTPEFLEHCRNNVVQWREEKDYL